MNEAEFREGYYKDKYGEWQADRRSSKDRRSGKSHLLDHERRKHFRRKVDRELLNKDHRAMIEDALEDFAAEHGGRL